MSDTGWIKLHRRIQEWPLYFNEPFTKTQAWIDMLLIANHTKGYITIRGNIVEIKRGQIARGERELAKRWHWSREKVRHFLRYLVASYQITPEKPQNNRTCAGPAPENDEKPYHRTGHRKQPVNVYNIVNYELYQNDHTTKRATGHTTEKPQTIPQSIPEQEVKNVKNEKNFITPVSMSISEQSLHDLIQAEAAALPD